MRQKLLMIGVAALILVLALGGVAGCAGQAALSSSEATPTATNGEAGRSSSAPPESAERGWVGVTLGTADQGVRVASVVAGSPAEKAGLKQGDVIVRVDGNRVRQPSDVVRALSDVKAGEQVTLTVLRNGQELDVAVTTSKRPGSDADVEVGGAPLENWLRQLPGLENVGPGEALQRFVRANVTLIGRDGQEIKLTVVAGQVKAIADDSIAIDPNGESAGPESYRIVSSTLMREGSRKISPSDIRVGDTVVVVTKTDSSDALAVLRIVESKLKITLPRPSSIPGWDALREKLRDLGLPGLPEILVPDPNKDYGFKLN